MTRGLNTLEHQERVVAVQQLCDAIDREVECRSAAIRAVTAAQLSSFKAQMDLQLSKFSSRVQDMALKEFLKSCPGIEFVTSYDGSVKLQKEVPLYPMVQESKRSLHDMLMKGRDSLSSKNNSVFFTPFVDPITSAKRFPLGDKNKRRADQVETEDLSWPEYCARLQALGLTTGLPESLGCQPDSPLSSKGRLPKDGETILSLNGSPLGQYGSTHANADRPATVARPTRSLSTRSIADAPATVARAARRKSTRNLGATPAARALGSKLTRTTRATRTSMRDL